MSVTGVGYIKALYPFVWAAGMIGTGQLADRIGRKPPVVAGMFIQAIVTAVSGLLAWAFMDETHPRPPAREAALP